MPQNQQRRSDIWWRGHNDALAGDPPNESYYHYYYEYKLAYDQVRRDQRRSRQQRLLTAFARRMLVIVPALLLLGGLGYAGWRVYGPAPSQVQQEAVVAPTATPRPTPRPTLPPPTPTPEPFLRADSFAVITGTEGAPLRARTEPGVNAGIKTRFREGQNVRVLDGPQAADGRDWWLVEADGEQGWAAADFLKPIDAPAP